MRPRAPETTGIIRARLRLSALQGSGNTNSSGGWDGKAEGCPSARCIFDGDLSAMGFYDGAGHRQAESGAISVFSPGAPTVAPEEAFKYMVEKLVRDARSAVGDSDADVVSIRTG